MLGIPLYSCLGFLSWIGWNDLIQILVVLHSWSITVSVTAKPNPNSCDPEGMELKGLQIALARKPRPRFHHHALFSFSHAIGHMWSSIVDFDRRLFIPEPYSYVSKSCHLVWAAKFYICGPCDLSLSIGRESFDFELGYPYTKTMFALSC